jgi:hypothetical protein
MPNVAEIIREHVTLDVKCVDRLYLGGHLKTGHTWTGQNRP